MNTDLTHVLSQIEAGDPTAASQLLPLVYNELRHLAAAKLSQENPDQTLQATALVHEAYLRLVGAHDQHWNSRGHFFGAAAEAMRRILVERARRKRRPKHGGDLRRLDCDSLDAAVLAGHDPNELVLAVDEALEKLARESAVKAEVVKLRFFAGLSVEETAAALGISRATADRYWTYAKTFLYCELEDADKP